MTPRRAAWALAAVVAVAVAVPAAAQPRDPAAEAQKIFTSVMSPYCPGLLLADCPSPAAFELRAEIRKRLEAGESAADIERDLYNQYGEVLRAVPPPAGAGWWLWVAPAIVLALSLAALMWFLARNRREPEAPSPGAATDPALEERLQQELEDVT